MELKQLIKLQTARQRPGVLIGSSELKFAKSTPCRRDSASSLRLISAAVEENNEVASSYQMTFSLDPFTRWTYKACTNNAAEARPVLSSKSLRKEIGTRMIRIRFLAPREGKKGNGCSFPNPLLPNVSLIRKRSLGSPDYQPMCRLIRAKEDCKQSKSTKLILKKLIASLL